MLIIQEHDAPEAGNTNLSDNNSLLSKQHPNFTLSSTHCMDSATMISSYIFIPTTDLLSSG